MREEQLILSSAQEYNILPITSRCDAACVFCSHQHNPAQVETVSFGPRTLAEAERTMTFLDGSRPIFIGESATRIVEGEPLTHPQLREILLRLRQRFSQTVISLTTNGIRLDREMARFLRDLGRVEINLSLNSASPLAWQMLMGRSKCPGASREAASWLREYDIPFHGSLVAMPHVVGWQDVGDTICYLDQQGARTIRVFLPGYSHLAKEELRCQPQQLHRELASFIRLQAETCGCPLMLEPPLLQDLSPVVIGAIRESPAWQAGIRRDDLILAVDKTAPRSRVEAWQLLQQTGQRNVRVRRQGQDLEVAWENRPGEKSGVVMAYDFDMQRHEEIAAYCRRFKPGRVLLLCSPLAAPVMRCLPVLAGNADLLPVTSRFFGGSIAAAGLLTVQDFAAALKAYGAGNPMPQAVLLPREAFDNQGRDLTGQGCWQLEEEFQLPLAAL